MRWRGDRMLRLEIDGADELVEGMKKLVAECPKAVSDALFEVAESFNEDVNAKMPGSYSDKIKKWKIQGAKEGTSSFVTSTNRAPHFHLVENGHAKYDFHGHFTGGFVPGKHYAEQTRQEYQDKYPKMMQEKINRLIEKHNL